MNVERIYGSSSLEEIKQRQAQMEYRRLWLKSLIDEIQLEIEALPYLKEQISQENKKNTSVSKILGFIKGIISNPEAEVIEENNKIFHRGTMLEFIDRLSDFALEVDLNLTTLADIEEREEKLHYRASWLKHLLKITERELNLISMTEEQEQNNENNVPDISGSSKTILKMLSP
ncbi:MAG: hypothetical protein KME28_09940 [Pelatocladus maniniholoensis HA4357-MV3]|jgi:hypothetical protein|uniref:Uncharacterized protein n=1 Tax=Pelatocladus maniniholoensis HA4357-MV3 TaxID=1117104 RepID=A0A9E3LSZ5_9NOST|nr:hypothetical protein [Pelatocladus maniniholoensis HA4357-MV3]BAZ66704.1 hypothetical protein NIES4106_14560 [Fischerella sp. NIES-4106]